MNRHSIKLGNARRGSHPESPVAPPPAPVLTYDSGGLWHVTCAGPPLAAWAVWKRCNSAADWRETIQIGSSQFPVPTNLVLAGNEVWWQIKLVGLDVNDQPMTPFSNVISSPNAPE